MALIKTVNVSLRLNGVDILNSISLCLNRGEFIGLLGPSGCGKSTLVKVLLGFYHPSEGEVVTESISSDQTSNGIRRGYVPQEDIVHKTLTVGRALYFSYVLNHNRQDVEKTAEKEIDKLLKTMDLKHRQHTRIKRLSGGERKRVNLALELLNDPELLFLDEPTSGLDPYLEKTMMKLFRKLSLQNRCLVVTTHRLANVTLFDQVLFLVSGFLVFAGKPEELLAFFEVDDFEHIYTKSRLLTPPRLRARYLKSHYFRAFMERQIPEITSRKSSKNNDISVIAQQTGLSTGKSVIEREREKRHQENRTENSQKSVSSSDIEEELKRLKALKAQKTEQDS